MGKRGVKNIGSNIPGELSDELVQTLFEGRTIRIDRIVSHGQVSPPGFWYDQEASEFVMVIKGRAKLCFDGEEGLVMLGPGDYLMIPARVRHRVEWTDPDQDTVWLAIYCESEHF